MGRTKGSKNKKTLRYWTEEEKKYLSEITLGRGYLEITEMMTAKFNYDYTKTQIASAIKRYGLSTGRTGRFEKGRVPFNKGTKGMTSANRTSFKKGNIPPTYLPIGSEAITRDGYTIVKVSDQGTRNQRWRSKHRLIWEKHHGPVPDGHAIVFGDGDKTNLSIDNLILVTRAQLSVMNTKKLIKNNVELTQAGANIAQLMITINKAKKKK
jgi:hypothetical protein